MVIANTGILRHNDDISFLNIRVYRDSPNSKKKMKTLIKTIPTAIMKVETTENAYARMFRCLHNLSIKMIQLCAVLYRSGGVSQSSYRAVEWLMLVEKLIIT